MGALVGQIVLYGLAAAFAAPIAAVVSALILGNSKTPIGSALLFVAGAAFLDIVFAAVVLAILGPSFNGGDAAAFIDIGLGVIFVALGVLAVLERPDPARDAAQRERAVRLTSAGPSRMIVAGIVVQVINFDAIAVVAGAMKDIAAAGLTATGVIVAAAFAIALMLIPYWVPVAAFAIAPGRAKPALAVMTEWILSHARQLEMATGLGFGAIFLVKGVAALLG
jgi:Sap, sulfolipid-1-addressing protein